VDLSYDNNDVLHPVIDNDAEVKISAKELAELIRQLPTGYQTIFNLHAVEGYTHVEIGKMLGISEGTSRSQYSRARSLLIEWINKNETSTKKEFYVR
jgi:RNA polymerase sigma-70 factor (ECF subfamily)